MRIDQILLLAAIFGIVAVSVAVVIKLLTPDTVRRRMTQVVDGGTPEVGQAERAPWVETVVQISRPFAKLSIPKEGWENSPLRTKFVNAGWREASAPAIYFAAKTILAIGLPLVCLAVAGPYLNSGNGRHFLLVLLVLAALGYYLPNGVLSRQVRRRQQAIFEDFPDALDLLTVCVEAGLGMDAALTRVADEMHIKSQALSEELQLVLLEMRAGLSKEVALRNLALRTGVEDIDVLVAMLIQAERFGTSVGESLRVHSENLRLKRRLRAEEAAGKISVKLLFPLIFCIFPTLMLVLLGPAVIQVMRVLVPTLTAHGAGAGPL
ncbi:MAG: type II secretion system F family protein [Burkholderiales bacterium]|nr:type II secretion system F family protein [Burkholderiales bacterium]MDE2608589.1 type II secretion system F family protein [Burkholderiales bacterium]